MFQLHLSVFIDLLFLRIQTIHAVLKFSAPTYIHNIDNILIVNTWVLKQVSTPSVSADAQAFSTRPPGCSDFIQVTATYWQPPRDTLHQSDEGELQAEHGVRNKRDQRTVANIQQCTSSCCCRLDSFRFMIATHNLLITLWTIHLH